LFIGFAGDLVVGVWVGNDDNSPMTGAVVGGTVPAKLWHKFMVAALTHDGTLRPARAPEPVDPGPGDALTGVISDTAQAAIDDALDRLRLDGAERDAAQARRDAGEPDVPQE